MAASRRFSAGFRRLRRRLLSFVFSEIPPMDLIHFGAVHYALVSPKPPPSATPEQLRIYKEVTDPSVLQKRSSIKGKSVRAAQKTFRITDVKEFVEAGTYLRVHVHPKRFPRCYEVDWNSRIIAVTDLYVILDKPAGISEKQVKKLYLALAAAPVPVGIISHYMRPVNVAPRLVSEDLIESWHLCQIEVLECNEVPWPNASIEKSYNIDDCGWPSKNSAYECRINLLTGKTHQVRAQLAAIGAPVVGDSMYMPAAVAEMVNPHVNPFGNSRRRCTSEQEKAEDRRIEEWISCHGKEPRASIGLQASRISWDDGKCCYEAQTPWWRQENELGL